jgi:serine/threonine protein kinase
VHGKVKLARSLETGDHVAIKIIPRFSKKRRLGRVTVTPEDKTKREIAILKKVRHPNVVGLLEVIDDPELKKIYMVLEHVELGEIVWRKKGTPLICLYERRRIERELRGDNDMGEEAHYFKIRNDRLLRREAQREKASKLQLPPEYWSLEHGIADEEDDMASLSRHSTQESLTHFAPRSYTSHTSMVRSNPVSGPHSRATSRTPSRASSTAAHTPMPTEFDIGPIDSDNEDDAPGPLPSIPSNHSSAAALDAQNIGRDGNFRGRSPSMADSIISHMSSLDDVMPHDAFEEDFSYVPCFTIEQARSTFRDIVLGLEYLHYQGIVHRDIKPANLLWTKDYRVKISDFGVSYFGRPIRDGETEENISESDAQDFDDDLELAKTVGTPAFFAPELCYTDIDVEQPKVTDQIDVWSLGVTLYCLIYARIPFLAEDEYQLFRAIAHQDVYIPRRRLKAVNPSPLATQASLSNKSTLCNGPYRQDGELVLEDIDDELYDLLRRMLIKDPAERLKLREVKRHPWVIKGIDNVIGWLDDTDPSRKTAGKKIQVDDRELERAVVPITFLERARSAMKKTVGKVFGRGEGSRRRAASSANSSGTDGSPSTPVTPMRDARRASLRGDESYFAAVKESREPGEHPLAQSVSASPEQPVNDNDPFAEQFQEDTLTALQTPRRKKSEAELGHRPVLQDRTISTADSIQTVIRRLSHSRSFSDSPQSATVPRLGSPESLFAFTDHNGAIIRDTSRSLFDNCNMEIRAQSSDGTTRTRSADRALFNANDKHSEPSVAVSNAIAPGNFEHPSPKRHQYARSIEVSLSSAEHPFGLPSSHFFRYSNLAAYQQSASETDVPHVTERMYAASMLDDRPATANRTPEGVTPAPRVYHESTAESFARAQEQLDRRRRMEEEKAEEEKEQARQSAAETRSEAASSCPPSPDDDIFHQKQEEEAKRAKSSSSVGSVGLMSPSPITSPSDMTSPISSMNYSSVNLGSTSDQPFPSDPSLPTLISGASSVSADNEGDFLAHPGVVRDSAEATGDTPDTLTPPSLSKEPSHDSELPNEHKNITTLPIVADEDEGYNADGDLAIKTEDDDSDSDEGLTMSRKKKPPKPKHSGTLVRRDTNASVGSTETAKKVSMTE